MTRSTHIVGMGSYLPLKVLTNCDLEKMVETTDEWIRIRTGIRERHIASDDEASSDLGLAAARKALDEAKVKPDEIDLIVVATITPDMNFPSTACVIQDRLGAKKAGAFDVSAACSGFVYALSVAHQAIVTGAADTVLVVAAETLSKITDWKDRNTCVLLGDGAGAVVLRSCEEEKGFLSFSLGANGGAGELLYLPGGGSRCPATHESVEKGFHYVKMKGNELFKVAVRVLAQAAEEALSKCRLKTEEVDLLIPHQANIRIIQAMASRLGLPMEKVYSNVDRCGNTSAASIAIALDEAHREGRIKEGNIIVLDAFGGGLTWGACVIRW